MKKIILLVFIAITSKVSLAQALAYKQTVRAYEKDGCNYLSIGYKNIGKVPMYFEPSEPTLMVMDSANNIIRRLGPIAEYPSLALSDYKKVLPGEIFNREISLNRSYRVDKKGYYKVVVYMGYADPVARKVYKNGTVLRKFKSNGLCGR